MSEERTRQEARARADRAVRDLESLRDQSERARVRRAWRWSPIGRRRGPDSFWFRAQYLLAADAAHQHLEAWMRESGTADQAAVRPMDEATKLVTAIERELASRPDPGAGEAFHSFMADIEAPALIMWAGVMLLGVGSAGSLDADMPSLDGVDLHCALASRVEKAAVTPTTVVEVCTGRLRMPARARYNMACYNAVAAMIEQRQGHLGAAESEAALFELRLAAVGLPRATMHWARRDPCFERLRKSDEYAAEFDDVVS